MALKDGSVLILDDQNSLRDSLKMRFEKLGSTVYTSGHIERGLSLLEGLVKNNKAPEVIIMDVRLPDSYGFNSLSRIQHTLGETIVPIIVASWGFSEPMVFQMRLYGVVGYVEKPIFIDKIFNFSIQLLDIIDANTSAAKQAKNIISKLKAA